MKFIQNSRIKQNEINIRNLKINSILLAPEIRRNIIISYVCSGDLNNFFFFLFFSSNRASLVCPRMRVSNTGLSMALVFQCLFISCLVFGPIIWLEANTIHEVRASRHIRWQYLYRHTGSFSFDQ